jgi:hypothetical protein
LVATVGVQTFVGSPPGGDVKVIRQAREPVASQRFTTVAFEEFTTRVLARLDKGRQAYGDRSFDRAPGELLAEIREELEDVCGWSFVLWCRLADLEQALAERIAAAHLPAGGAR